MVFEKIGDWFKSKTGIDYKRVSQSLKNVYNDTKTLLNSINDYADELLYKSPGIAGVYGTLKNYASSNIGKNFSVLKQDYTILKDSLKHSLRTNPKKNIEDTLDSMILDDFPDKKKYVPHEKTEEYKKREEYRDNAADRINSHSYLDNIAPKQLSEIIQYKNHRHKVIDDIIRDYDVDAKTFIRDVAKAKALGKYESLPKIYYDKAYAPVGMNTELVELYQKSDSSLREVSRQLEKKYGMHISASTISRHARRALSQRYGKTVKNRKSARNIKKGKK